MFRLPLLLFSVLFLLQCPVARAHDVEPRYGGLVKEVKDIAYEIVNGQEGVFIHVDDHGTPLPTTGVIAKLLIFDGDRRQEFSLKPNGENRLFATGANVGERMRASVVLTMPSGRQVVVQYP